MRIFCCHRRRYCCCCGGGGGDDDDDYYDYLTPLEDITGSTRSWRTMCHFCLRFVMVSHLRRSIGVGGEVASYTQVIMARVAVKSWY